MGYWMILVLSKNDQSNRAISLEVPYVQPNPRNGAVVHPYLPSILNAESLREFLLLVLAITCDRFAVSHWLMYPLVICYLAVENHHFLWENSLCLWSCQ